MSKYKNAKVTPEHAKHVVRKCWELYFRWLDNTNDINRQQYLTQYRLAKEAIRLSDSLFDLPEDPIGPLEEHECHD